MASRGPRVDKERARKVAIALGKRKKPEKKPEKDDEEREADPLNEKITRNLLRMSKRNLARGTRPKKR